MELDFEKINQKSMVVALNTYSFLKTFYREHTFLSIDESTTTIPCRDPYYRINRDLQKKDLFGYFMSLDVLVY